MAEIRQLRYFVASPSAGASRGPRWTYTSRSRPSASRCDGSPLVAAFVAVVREVAAKLAAARG